MKKIFLLAVAALMLAPANAQLMLPTKPAAPASALVRNKPLAQMQEMQMYDPGTPLPQAPRRASANEVYYKRPAGAYPALFAMDPESFDLYYYPYTTFQVTLFAPYTFKGVANGSFIGDPYFKWNAEYYNKSIGDYDMLYVNGVQDLTMTYDYAAFPEAPTIQVIDDLDTYTYQCTSNIYNNGDRAAIMVPWPIWEEVSEGESTLLKSSFDFASNRRTDDGYYLLTYYSGMTPFGNNHDGFWFGKNAGLNAVHVDGIAQAFEKPEHPYLLKEVVLYASQLKVTANVDMQCKVYRISGVPDYNDSGYVFMPEEPGELIALGTAHLTPNMSGECLLPFTLYNYDEDGIMSDVTPTIDDAILVVIDGYNDPDMSALAQFTAAISYEMTIDDGMGERAYLKVGKDDANGNFDGHYQWQGLNNFFTSGIMKTGLTIFITTDHPFLTSNYYSDDYEYTFPAAGGVMEKTLTDENGENVTMRSIEIASWLPTDEFSITCDGGELPSWLNISAFDGTTNGEFNHLVNVLVTANEMEVGTDYREAVVRFAIPGNYIDYKFKQVRQSGEDPDTTVQEKTPMPEITVDVTDKYVIIGATGNGNVMLYFDGFYSPENPVHYVRTGVDRSVVVTATAQEDGKLISDTARRVVDVPAVEVPVEGYWLQMYDATVNAGDTIIIPVEMWNENDVVAFQTDIELPDGFELVKEDGKYAISLSDRASADHTVMANELSDGKIRVLCYSTDNIAFTGDRGELFYLPVKVSKDANDGTVRLRNTRFTLSDLTEYNIPSVAVAAIIVNHIIPGDVNNSGDVTVTDIVATAQYILEMNPDPFIFEAADMNEDGIITVTDITLIANLILNPSMNMPLRVPALSDVNDDMNGEAIILAGGETHTVSINLDNLLAYTGFQLDMQLPEGMTASNFALTNRDGSHTLAVNELSNGNLRVLCYSTALSIIDGNNGAVLTFDVTSSANIDGYINVNGIELVTPACQALFLGNFAIPVNNPSAVKELYEATAMKIYAAGLDIIVESPVSQTVNISDLAGRVRRVNVTAGRNIITGNSHGVYIVTAGGKASKLMLK